jgi:hypothetical protein
MRAVATTLLRVVPVLFCLLPELLMAAASLAAIPSQDEYCVSAQRIVSRTEQPVDIVVHQDFDAFVKSKAIIPDAEGAIPQIQQLNWTNDGGVVVGISCKLKSADHLNLTYGPETAGPDGLCQDMNREIFRLLGEKVERSRYASVVFDDQESVTNEANPGMVGPDWLRPYRAMFVSESGELNIRAKGFQVDFTDPRFADAPARFRGVHYCHFIAPGHLLSVLEGTSEAETMIGREVDISGYSAPGGQ